MSDGRKKLIARSAKLFNKAAAAFYSFPVEENGFVPEDPALIRTYNNQRPFGPAPRLCYAPFSNMFFNTEGRAIVCCKNTKVVLGQVPQQSIHDMWFGEKTALLREYLLHHDLTHGCYKCREALHSGNFGSVTAAGFDFVRAWPESEYPRLMEFELSNTCNLECAMCSGRVSSSIRKNREHKEPLKMAYDQDFVSQLDEFIPHLKQARFYGGEPFLIDIYYDIWSRMIAANPAINLYVLTNGTVLNDRIRDLLSRGNFTLNVSMDSFQKQTYEAIRQHAVFEETLEHMHYFREWMKGKRKKLTLFITPTRLNWQEIPEMLAQCNRWDIEVYFSTAYFPERLALWTLPPEQMDEILKNFRGHNLIEGNNKIRLEELIRDLEYWAAAQRSDPGFKQKFEQDMQQQEFIHEENKPVINACDVTIYKDSLLTKLKGSGLISNPELLLIVEKVDRLIAVAEVESALVYFFLQQLSPGIFLDKMKKLSEPEIIDFFKKKQEELSATHHLIR